MISKRARWKKQQTSKGFPLVALLKKCAQKKDLCKGSQIHAEIRHSGLLQKDAYIGSTLISMYAKCGALLRAQQVLDALPLRDVVSWTALITGYAQQGHGQEALICFQHMLKDGHSPDAFAYASVLKACGIIHDIDTGKRIHREIVSHGLLRDNVVLGTALVDMYSKCGEVGKAQEVLDELSIRDVVSWSALIVGYVQQGRAREALACFQRMRDEGLSPSAISYPCILKACGLIQDTAMGGRIHDEIVCRGLLKKDVVLGNALVDMYAKCGVLVKAQKVLEELPVRDVISWNALIAGYGQHGESQKALLCFQKIRKEGLVPDIFSWNALIGGYAQQGLAMEALDCFQRMQQEGLSPDAITFLLVLNACSHSGFVNDGQTYFDNMRDKYGIEPDKEHYSCMVDLFGRARLFTDAMRVIKMMPLPDHPPIWSALLGACQKYGSVKLARFAFEHAIQLPECEPAVYVSMRDIYAAASMHEYAQKFE